MKKDYKTKKELVNIKRLEATQENKLLCEYGTCITNSDNDYFFDLMFKITNEFWEMQENKTPNIKKFSYNINLKTCKFHMLIMKKEN